jgi:hypothetical protein
MVKFLQTDHHGCQQLSILACHYKIWKV